MQIVYARSDEAIELGHQGENLARRVIFDISQWISLYGGGGEVRLLHQRQNDTNPYPVPTSRDASLDADSEDTPPGLVYWDVTRTDTDQQCRYGKAELRYYIGDALVKSDTFRTSVLPALTPPSGSAPEAGADWLQAALQEAKDEMKADITPVLSEGEEIAEISMYGKTYTLYAPGIPSVNGVRLTGRKSIEDLGVDTATNSEIQAMIDAQYMAVFGGN